MSKKTERKFTKILNRDKTTEYWKKLQEVVDKKGNTFAVHIISEKRSKILGRKVYPKADLCLAKGEIDESYLRENNYYLDEEDKEVFNLNFIPRTGISVKKPNSNKYTITKMNPSTFGKVFGSRALGAGASFYCRRKKDLEKNPEIVDGWGTSFKEVEEYFDSISDIEKLNSNLPLQEKKKIYRRTKSKANKEIESMIKNNKEISSFVFRGEGNFRQPFTAPWLYQDKELKKNNPDSFTVTTGSGRSKGDYTIVVKP